MSELLSQVLATLAAIFLGVAGIAGLFLGLDFLVGRLPQRLQPKVRPWAYIGPALLVLGFYLVYPTLHTLYLSFFDAKSERFVGFQNYLWTFTSPDMHVAFRNNLLWIVLMTLFSVGLGLVIAVLVDRVRYEPIAKSAIFLPVAISFVGASVIWRFVYAYKPANVPQIGLLNAIIIALGGRPVGWLVDTAVNNFVLIAVGVWLQTGFCMVILSAALKAIPREILEAARVDGASEWRIFWQITVPMIGSTIAVVATTVIINALKAFDIVYVMTNGNYGTEVIANRMYKEMFHFRNFGRASAIAVILLLAIIPVMAANIRRFQVQEEIR
ncbi:MAG: sugar ABC transporter permease [Anaerolineae bacterium]|nr:sugar ABC transporter permease [Anaerolineae bacterium]